MASAYERHGEIVEVPIYFKIIPLMQHKILLNNPFSETTSFKGYEYPLRLVMESILPDTPLFVELNVLTEKVKFLQITEFLIKTLSDYTGRCFDNTIINVIEIDHEFSVTVNDNLIISQRF